MLLSELDELLDDHESIVAFPANFVDRHCYWRDDCCAGFLRLVVGWLSAGIAAGRVLFISLTFLCLSRIGYCGRWLGAGTFVQR